MLKAALFDFDGLLVDTESPAYQAWSEIYREHGVELLLERWVACVGTHDASFDPVVHLSDLTGVKTLDRVALFADKERRKADVCQRLPLMPGALHRLDEARRLGWRVAVASSSSAAWVRGHMRRLGIEDRFDVVRTREDVEQVKPHPALYLSAAAALGVAPGDCVVLEDSLNGVLAAKAAGAYCIAVPNFVTRQLDFAPADRVVQSLADVSFAELFRSI